MTNLCGLHKSHVLKAQRTCYKSSFIFTFDAGLTFLNRFLIIQNARLRPFLLHFILNYQTQDQFNYSILKLAAV